MIWKIGDSCYCIYWDKENNTYKISERTKVTDIDLSCCEGSHESVKTEAAGYYLNEDDLFHTRFEAMESLIEDLQIQNRHLVRRNKELMKYEEQDNRVQFLRERRLINSSNIRQNFRAKERYKELVQQYLDNEAQINPLKGVE